ncbi:MAG TPA: phenylacetate--CoA ligase family protein, partial [Planctomycetaceae bacterium]|nr:phenylacetate--CoA ligase family protein [Planctomycetaceae bacterium]
MPTLPESLSRDELKERQEARLRQLIAEVLPHNAFWSKRFAEAGVKPHDLWTLDDLAQLPLTDKQSLVK